MQNRTDDPRDVVVVTGAGGMGTAVARRLGSGRTLILADYSRERLDQVVAELSAEGYAAQGVPTDVSDRASVEELARIAAEQGRITAVVHTAGVAAATSSVRSILDVDLLGTVYVIEAFEKVAVRGTSLVCVASLAGHMASISAEDEAALATAPAEELLGLDAVTGLGDDATAAYILAKRANHVRVGRRPRLEPARRPRQHPQPRSHRHRHGEGGGRLGRRRAHAQDARRVRRGPAGHARRGRRRRGLPHRPRGAVHHRHRSARRRRAGGLDPPAHAARTLVVTERAVSKHIGDVFLKLGLPPSDSGHRRVLAVLAHLNGR
jgi:hypothetical protein